MIDLCSLPGYDYSPMIRSLIDGTSAFKVGDKVMGLQELVDAGYTVTITKDSFRVTKERE